MRHHGTTAYRPFALAALAAATIAAPLPAVAAPGGELGTLELGPYRCGVVGDALGDAIRPMTDADFEVVAASSYRNGEGRGTYLRTGDTVTMTSGPHRGQRFQVESRRLLHRLEADGSKGPVSCSLGPSLSGGRESMCPMPGNAGKALREGA